MRASTLFVRSLLCLMFAGLIVIGCDNGDDNDDNNNPPAESEYLWIVLDDDSVKMVFDSLPKITIEGEQVIRLNEFVTAAFIPPYVDNDGNPHDSRVQYGYRIVGEDGFSAHDNRGYPDNTWQHLNYGYVLLSTRRAIFPDDSVDLAGAYNVQNMRWIRLYRKFDVVRPVDVSPDSASFVEFADVTAVTVTNPDGQPESALPLADFVTRIVLAPENYQYNLRSLDDFGPTTDMTWEQLQTGYWLLTTARTMFTDTTLVGGRYRVRVVKELQVAAP